LPFFGAVDATAVWKASCTEAIYVSDFQKAVAALRVRRREDATQRTVMPSGANTLARMRLGSMQNSVATTGTTKTIPTTAVAASAFIQTIATIF
jgi:hypothetical protein